MTEEAKKPMVKHVMFGHGLEEFVLQPEGMVVELPLDMHEIEVSAPGKIMFMLAQRDKVVSKGWINCDVWSYVYEYGQFGATYTSMASSELRIRVWPVRRRQAPTGDREPRRNSDACGCEDGMTYQEKLILKWWKSFRPGCWTELAHIENPTINMCSGRTGEKELAKQAAKIARRKYYRDGRRKP